MNRALASIHPGAKIAENVTISPFTMIYDNVEIGEGTWIGPNVTIMEGARIGKNCRIYPGAVISAEPQDLKYEGEETLTYIGDNTTIRECVTVNKGTKALGYTKIGDNCLLMAYVHIAHDCVIGNNVVLVNGIGLAGHIEIDDFAFVGGMCAVHQFTKIGTHAFIAGGSHVRKDVPPYVKAGRDPLSFVGINSTGLKRRGFSQEKIEEIHRMYKVVYQDGNNMTQAVSLLTSQFPPSVERDDIINFIKGSDRGLMKGYKSRIGEDKTTE